MPTQDATTLDRCVTDPAFAAQNWAFLLEKVASQNETELEQATEALENCDALDDTALVALGKKLSASLAELGPQRIYWICTLLGRGGKSSSSFQESVAKIACDPQVELHTRERAAWCLGEIGNLQPNIRSMLQAQLPSVPERMHRLLQVALGVATWILFSCLFIGCDIDTKELKDVVETGAKKLAERSANGGTPTDTASSYSSSPASPTPQGQLVSTGIGPTNDSAIPQRTAQTILIASFNIQTFGEKKLANRPMAERIAAIIRLFDVVGIQEVRATDQTVIPRLLQIINAQGARYDYILGPRLGRTNSKEQYCYIYDTNRLVSSPQASYTVEDNADLLHREPLVGRFVTRVPQGYPPFTFSLMNMHTDPDEVKLEMPVMHTVLRGVREYEWATASEDDVLMMGDLNCEPAKFGPLAQVPGIFWIIDNQPTNTRKTKIYDNIIFDRGLTAEFTGRAGVLDFAQWFGISIEEALTISDHMPVWGEFTILEQPRPGSPVVANQPMNGVPVR